MMKNGFTLIELMVVIAIIAILAAIIVPAITNRGDNVVETDSSNWARLEYNGHSYLKYSDWDTANVIHNPDCECLDEDSSSNSNQTVFE